MNTLLSLFLLFLNHSLHQDVYYQITQFVTLDRVLWTTIL